MQNEWGGGQDEEPWEERVKRESKKATDKEIEKEEKGKQGEN